MCGMCGFASPSEKQVQSLSVQEVALWNCINSLHTCECAQHHHVCIIIVHSALLVPTSVLLCACSHFHLCRSGNQECGRRGLTLFISFLWSLYELWLLLCKHLVNLQLLSSRHHATVLYGLHALELHDPRISVATTAMDHILHAEWTFMH